MDNSLVAALLRILSLHVPRGHEGFKGSQCSGTCTTPHAPVCGSALLVLRFGFGPSGAPERPVLRNGAPVIYAKVLLVLRSRTVLLVLRNADRAPRAPEGRCSGSSWCSGSSDTRCLMPAAPRWRGGGVTLHAYLTRARPVSCRGTLVNQACCDGTPASRYLVRACFVTAAS